MKRGAQLLPVCDSNATGTLIKGFHCAAMNKGKKQEAAISVHMPGNAAMPRASEIPASSAAARGGAFEAFLNSSKDD